MSSVWRLWHPVFRYPYWNPGLNKDTEILPAQYIVPIPKPQRNCVLHPRLFALPPLKLPLPLSPFPSRDALGTRRWGCVRTGAPLLSSWS